MLVINLHDLKWPCALCDNIKIQTMIIDSFIVEHNHSDDLNRDNGEL